MLDTGTSDAMSSTTSAHELWDGFTEDDLVPSRTTWPAEWLVQFRATCDKYYLSNDNKPRMDVLNELLENLGLHELRPHTLKLLHKKYTAWVSYPKNAWKDDRDTSPLVVRSPHDDDAIMSEPSPELEMAQHQDFGVDNSYENADSNSATFSPVDDKIQSEEDASIQVETVHVGHDDGGGGRYNLRPRPQRLPKGQIAAPAAVRPSKQVAGLHDTREKQVKSHVAIEEPRSSTSERPELAPSDPVQQQLATDNSLLSRRLPHILNPASPPYVPASSQVASHPQSQAETLGSRPETHLPQERPEAVSTSSKPTSKALGDQDLATEKRPRTVNKTGDRTPARAQVLAQLLKRAQVEAHGQPQLQSHAGTNRRPGTRAQHHARHERTDYIIAEDGADGELYEQENDPLRTGENEQDVEKEGAQDIDSTHHAGVPQQATWLHKSTNRPLSGYAAFAQTQDKNDAVEYPAKEERPHLTTRLPIAIQPFKNQSPPLLTAENGTKVPRAQRPAQTYDQRANTTAGTDKAPTPVISSVPSPPASLVSLTSGTTMSSLVSNLSASAVTSFKHEFERRWHQQTELVLEAVANDDYSTALRFSSELIASLASLWNFYTHFEVAEKNAVIASLERQLYVPMGGRNKSSMDKRNKKKHKNKHNGKSKDGHWKVQADANAKPTK